MAYVPSKADDPIVNENGDTVTTEQVLEPEPAATTTDTSTQYQYTPPAATMPPGGDVMSNLSNAKTEIMKLPWMQEIAGMRTPMAYAFIRESDVFWWKNVWRVFLFLAIFQTIILLFYKKRTKFLADFRRKKKQIFAD